jgi:hypothetical protein
VVIITWILRLLVALFLLRLVLRAIFGDNAKQRRVRQTKQRQERIGGTLVRCAQCGTHVPQANTITVGGQTFCSATCREAAAQRRAG